MNYNLLWGTFCISLWLSLIGSLIRLIIAGLPVYSTDGLLTIDGDLLAATLALVGLWVYRMGLPLFFEFSFTGLINSKFKMLVCDCFFWICGPTTATLFSSYFWVNGGWSKNCKILKDEFALRFIDESSFMCNFLCEVLWSTLPLLAT